MKVNGKNIRERILALVEKDQRYAEDDKLLIAAIWYQEGVIVPSSDTLDARYDEYKQAKDDLGY